MHPYKSLPAKAGQLEEVKATITAGAAANKKMENLEKELDLDEMRQKLIGVLPPLEPKKWMEIIKFLKDTIEFELFGKQNELWSRFV